jgi:putative holliday junction resolvase
MSTRYLGIDYGTKRIGVGVADGEQKIATPLKNLAAVPSAETNAKQVAVLIKEQNAAVVVIGESKDFNGADNSIMKKIRIFAEALSKETGEGVKIVFEPEFMTTMQAERLQGKGDLIDSSAAALILQSYLDRNKE